MCLIFLPLFCFSLFVFVFFFLSFFLVSSGITRFLVWKMVKKLHCYATVVIFLTISLQACADDLQCIYGTYAEYGTMLRSHVIQEHNAVNILACSLLCNSNIRCQSINYVTGRHLCELNSRTKEARPEDYVQDADWVYLTRPSERGSELPSVDIQFVSLLVFSLLFVLCLSILVVCLLPFFSLPFVFCFMFLIYVQ